MNPIINYDNLQQFAYVNDKICSKPIRGIVLSFFGLGGTSMYDFDTKEGELYAEQGLLYVVPYNNPWAWMNPQAVHFTDEIIDVLIEKYGLDESIPIVSTGGSMGGQSALVYSYYAKRMPVSCVANCPVCDVVFHFTERNDLPRTLYSALFNVEGDPDSALKSISPLHLAEKMPKIKYHLFHCTADQSVNIDAHSRKFVDVMRQQGHDITFETVEGRGHCKLTLSAQRQFERYVIEDVLASEREGKQI